MRLGTVGLGVLASLAGCGGGGDSTPPVPEPECSEAPAILCGDDLGHEIPVVIEGSTAGAQDDFGRASCGRGGGTIEDAAFRWTAPRDGRYTFTTEGSSIDAFLSVRSGGCSGREVACSEPDEAGAAIIELDLAACQRVMVVIDGRSVDSVGAYRLAITGREEVCDDGVDDDGDGMADCADPDCGGAAACEQTGGSQSLTVLAREQRMLEEVNRRRAEGAVCGGEAMAPAAPLAMDDQLHLAARRHSEDMAERGYFSHTSPDGTTPGDRILATSFSGSSPFLENIAAGEPDPVRTVEGFMGSPGHCANIMEPTVDLIGIGYVEADDGTPFWTQNFASR